MEVPQSDLEAVPSSLIDSSSCNICRITEFQKLLETPPVLQVPLLQDRQLHKLSAMDEQRQIAGASCGKVLRMATAEMVAVFLIMFSVCGSTIANKKTNGDLNLLGSATAGGMSVMVMVFAVGHISGAHLNPAVTLAFASKRTFPIQLVSAAFQVPIYILAQLLGSTAAAAVLQALTGDTEASLIIPYASTTEAFIVELILGFNLMFVATAVSTGSSNSGELAGIAVGATVILNVLLGGAISGAAMSPMRSLGPAIVANKYNNVWIYVIAPPIGALAGTWTHSLLQITSPRISSSLPQLPLSPNRSSPY